MVEEDLKLEGVDSKAANCSSTDSLLPNSGISLFPEAKKLTTNEIQEIPIKM